MGVRTQRVADVSANKLVFLWRLQWEELFEPPGIQPQQSGRLGVRQGDSATIIRLSEALGPVAPVHLPLKLSPNCCGQRLL